MRFNSALTLLMLAGLLAAGGAASLAQTPSEKAVDNRIFGDLLKKYVKAGWVDYRGLKTEEGRLDGYLEVLEGVDPGNLGHNEQFAFYINAYNAWTLKLILSGYPGIESIRDLGNWLSSPWKKKICRIGGDTVSLDHIEHDILRPRFKDPRVHVAINCAARSCPPLRAAPYAGADLDRQLDEMAGAFINDPQRNYLKGDTLHVSRIFKWFGEDFGDDIVGFFLAHARGDLKRQLADRRNAIRLTYLEYDWSLNGR